MIRIRTCRRLHFGLLTPVPVQELDLVYGGLGIMVEAPSIEVVAEKAAAWQITGHAESTVRAILDQVQSHLPELKPLHLEVIRHAPAHQGWGTGTQLALAVAQACCLASQLNGNAAEMASWTRRGTRSGIGIAGFEQEGLLIDMGKALGGKRTARVHSIPFPQEWTFVLVEPGEEQGLFGDRERSAFSRLQQVRIETVKHMQRLIQDQIVPAVQLKDFDTFARSLTEYNRLAGTHYHEVQPGDYSSELNATRLELMCQAGAAGLGQSSWGPGLFAVFRDEATARSFVDTVCLPGCTLRVAGVKGSSTRS